MKARTVKNTFGWLFAIDRHIQATILKVTKLIIPTKTEEDAVKVATVVKYNLYCIPCYFVAGLCDVLLHFLFPWW